MRKSPVVEILPEEQAQMLAALRRAQYGDLLASHILLLCAAGRTPTAIADVLFCSRSGVYRTVRAYQAGTLGLESDDDGRLRPPVRTTGLVPSGSTAWPASGMSSSTSNWVRPWCLRTNSMSICYPKSAVPGCPRGAKWR